jgi:hypothetical protein
MCAAAQRSSLDVKRIRKESWDAMSADEALARVVDRTALIENILNQVLAAYCSPRDEARQFFWDVLLDSSILPLGAKVKVAMAISQELETALDQQSLHRLVSLRNAFAHHATDAHPVFVVGKTPDRDRLEHGLQVISNSGKLSRTSREGGLAEFDACYDKAKSSLLALLNAIRESETSGSGSVQK